VLVATTNTAYKDITACLFTNEAAAKSYQTGDACMGHKKANAPFNIVAEPFVEDSQVWLVLDNGFANVIAKKLNVVVAFQKEWSDADVTMLRAELEKIHSRITATFKDSDFDLSLKSCGQQNAFSEKRTASITICQEMFADLAAKKNVGAMAGVMLHEYGHSLLNRWGEPGASEEDMADQFAAAMLLKGGDDGRQLLVQWIKFWEQHDSVAEANYVLKNGDTHSLSIQRARNLNQILIYPEDFIRRWNKMLYRHMTTAELDRVIQRPSKTDDLDLAKQARLRQD
jgi:hypothetical protein